MLRFLGDTTKIAVVAVGGNVIASPRGPLSWEGQLSSASSIGSCVVRLESLGYRLVLTHGNGPQVGAILLQNEKASDSVPANPLDVCVAQSQAQIGYALQLGLQEAIAKKGNPRAVMPVITMVRVDLKDPAFEKPSKPIGPLHNEARARELQAMGLKVITDPRGGYRRVVPSPRPIEIVGARLLKGMLKQEGILLIAAGGGGIPVVRDSQGLRGIEAVVDKDITSSHLAKDLGAELLMMITDVPCAYLDYGTRSERGIRRMTAKEARQYHAEGHFPSGSMGPKVEAAIDFVETGGERAIITDVQNSHRAIKGEAGTTIVA